MSRVIALRAIHGCSTAFRGGRLKRRAKNLGIVTQSFFVGRTREMFRKRSPAGGHAGDTAVMKARRSVYGLQTILKNRNAFVLPNVIGVVPGIFTHAGELRLVDPCNV